MNIESKSKNIDIYIAVAVKHYLFFLFVTLCEYLCYQDYYFLYTQMYMTVQKN